MSTRAMPWLRVYTRMVDDDKLKLLAFEDRWHFVALLCIKGEGLLDKGDAPSLMMRKVAVKLGLDVRTLEEVARRLSEVGLIDQDTLQPLKWDGLQMRSDTDPTAAERKRRQRSKKAGHATRHEDGTDMSRVTGTDVTRTDIDTEEEEETDNKDLSSSGREGETPPPAPEGALPPASPPGRSRATRLPQDWVLPKRWGDWALQECPGWNAERVRRVAEMFRDYWLAKGGADARKADWEATWRNWVRREASGAQGADASASRPARPQTEAERRAAWMRDMQAASRTSSQPARDMGVIDVTAHPV